MAYLIGGITAHHVLDELLGDEDDNALQDALIIRSIFREDHIKTQLFLEFTVPNLVDDTFKRFFRMERGTVEIICQLLAGNVPPRAYPGGREEIPLEKKVLLTLRYLASQLTLLEISNLFGVTESTALKCRRDVITAVNDVLLKRFIVWPNGDLARIAQEFVNLDNVNFPNVMGAVDGSHIPIEAPHDSPQAYYNRKRFYSLVLQAVAIYDTRFTSIYVGWPGRVHDAKVLRNSNLWETGYEKSVHGQYHLLGDAAYPIKEWLLTPYRDNGHLTPQQTRFNKYLSAKRQVVERAFGLLKTRFRRLKHVHIIDLEETCKVISACCVLHNICILQNDHLQEVIDQDGNAVQAPAVPALQENDAQGRLKRIVITNTF